MEFTTRVRYNGYYLDQQLTRPSAISSSFGSRKTEACLMYNRVTKIYHMDRLFSTLFILTQKPTAFENVSGIY